MQTCLNYEFMLLTRFNANNIVQVYIEKNANTLTNETLLYTRR